jgi:hypothetical protein
MPGLSCSASVRMNDSEAVDIVGVAQDISLANDYSSLGVPRVESKHWRI